MILGYPDVRLLAGISVLSCEGEANPDWIGRASELSSADEGPSMARTKRCGTSSPSGFRGARNTSARWNENCSTGEIPISLAASGFNMSLGRAFFSLRSPVEMPSEFDRSRSSDVADYRGRTEAG